MLPFTVAGATKEIMVALMLDLSADCFLGANFMRAFQTVHDPTKNQLFVKSTNRVAKLEVATVGSGRFLN